jgi:RNA 2',3'-cyclic 3'-phosphodiesterase
MAIRTFLALDLNDQTRQRLVRAVAELPVGQAKIRWVESENLHVTVKFLGEVADADAVNVCRVVADAAGLVEPFDFQVRGIQAVPARGDLSMFWAGVADADGRMAAMFEVIEAALEELGFSREQRDFRPHVTLGRVKYARDAHGLRAAAARVAETDFGCVAADGIVVYSSQLTPEGPIYAPMGRGPFASPRAGGGAL